MRLRDLHPCDWCSKQLAGRMPDGQLSIQFYVVTTATALLNTQAINEHVGLMQMLGGSGALAEIFAPRPEVAVIVEDQPGAGGRDEALLCFDCFCSDISIAALAERVRARKGREAAAQAERERAAQAAERQAVEVTAVPAPEPEVSE